MADYFPVLDRAVSALDPNAAEDRRALYDRARTLFAERIQNADPPFSSQEVAAEHVALEQAIQRAEAAAILRASAPQDEQTAPSAATVEHAPPFRLRSRPRPGVIFAIAGGGIVLSGLIALIGYALWPRLWPVPRAVASSPVNYIYMQQPVFYRNTYPEGTIIVDKAQHFLYFTRSNVMALRYGIGNGPECADAAGLYRVLRKNTEPPLQRAFQLESDYRIHGTAALNNIGRALATGCFQLIETDINGLYDRVPIDTRVVVVD